MGLLTFHPLVAVAETFSWCANSLTSVASSAAAGRWGCSSNFDSDSHNDHLFGFHIEFSKNADPIDTNGQTTGIYAQIMVTTVFLCTQNLPRRCGQQYAPRLIGVALNLCIEETVLNDLRENRKLDAHSLDFWHVDITRRLKEYPTEYRQQKKVSEPEDLF